MAAWCALLVAVWCVAPGCSGGASAADADPAAVSEGPIDVEVWAGETWLRLMMRERNRACSCTFDELPGVGECATSSDGVFCDCYPDPAACVTTVRVWEAGAVIAEITDYDAFRDSAGIQLPAQAGPRELEIVGSGGCAGSMRAPLPDARSTQPAITMVTSDDEALYVAWSDSDPPASAAATITSGLWGHTCHGDDGGVVAIRGGPDNGDAVLSGWVTGFGPVLETRDAFGLVRASALATSAGTELWRTTRQTDGDWLIGDGYAGTATLTVDGFDRAGALTVRATLSGTSAEPLHSFSAELIDSIGAGWSIAVTAGAVTDRIEVSGGDGSYAGDTPHVVPAQVPALGVAGTQRYELSTSPVVLTGQGTTTGTITVALAAEWHTDAIIARPVVSTGTRRLPAP